MTTMTITKKKKKKRMMTRVVLYLSNTDTAAVVLAAAAWSQKMTVNSEFGKGQKLKLTDPENFCVPPLEVITVG